MPCLGEPVHTDNASMLRRGNFFPASKCRSCMQACARPSVLLWLQMMLHSHVSGGFWLQMPVALAGLVANSKHRIALECADVSKADGAYQHQARCLLWLRMPPSLDPLTWRPLVTLCPCPMCTSSHPRPSRLAPGCQASYALSNPLRGALGRHSAWPWDRTGKRPEEAGAYMQQLEAEPLTTAQLMIWRLTASMHAGDH